MKKVLIASPRFKYVCGRSKHVVHLIKLLAENGYDVVFVTDSSERISEIETLGAETVLSPVPLGGYNPLNFLRTLLLFLKQVSGNGIDIIHTHHRYVEAIAYFARLLLRHKDIKLITTVHSELKYSGLVSFPSDRVIAISGFVKKELIEKHKVNNSRITMIYNYIDETGNPPERVNNMPVIFSAGRFVPEKGFEILFEAAKMLKENSVELVLAGEGEDLEKYKAVLPGLKVNARIIPMVRDTGIYFDNCDLCVVPSVSEGLSFVIMEAGIRGKAVIASDTGGIPELITDNETGLLFEKGNARDLRDKLFLLIQDPGLRKRLGQNLKKKLLNEFSFSHFRQQTLSLYENL